MDKNYYNCIYMYTNKINNKKYVGQTKNLLDRHRRHVQTSFNKNAKRDYNTPFHRAIRKYGIENFEIKILAENIETQEKLNEYEIFFIKRYKTLNIQNGYNVAEGGYNNPFVGKTEKEMDEFKRKVSESRKGQMIGENNPFYGKKHTEETKNKISKNHANVSGENNPNYGKQMSESQKEKLRQINIGKIISEETKNKISRAMKGKNNPRAKMTIQYDKQGKIVKIWDYAKQASEELGINTDSITRCCRGEGKSAGGFYWKYLNDVLDDDLKRYII